jgi:hypothetical protein
MATQTVEERLASFYLGQEYDLAKGAPLDGLVHYDARDLTTHAVCLGMTGSGKTGLGVILLEEAALDSVPSLVIDPKGDMTNLLLTFPDLRPEDFRPWVNEDDARRKNLDLDAYAAQTADQWRQGLARSGEGADRIRRLKESADFVIYTPGSRAGRQVSILDTFKAPTLSWDDDSETLRDKIQGIVSALLALVGIEADPMRSREHILLSNILEYAWRKGEDLDLAQLILRIQKPPFTQLGVFPVETFFPEKDRMGLAMLLNGLIASPTFADWVTGQPLDIDSLLHGPSGKPQVSILYIAHLSDAERQFFVTLLLEQVVSWMRAQTGTTSLRAILYMDEVFGYLPPHPGNPPSKKPMLTLLKQARAFGLGLILATQNPVDLDYKALSNAGTWFIGRMQAERDKERLLDGLEGVQAGSSGFSRATFDRMISGIKPRVFLLHNVNEDRPQVFQTRWAMSFLRGPLTRDQVRELASRQAPVAPAVTAPGAAAVPAAVAKPASGRTPAAPPPQPETALPYGQVPPQLPSAVKQVFLPAQVSLDEALRAVARERGGSARPVAGVEGTLVYQPALVGLATVHFAHTKSRQTHAREVSYLLPLEAEGQAVDWSGAQAQLQERDLEREPAPEARFAELPVGLGDAKRYTVLEKEFSEYLFYNLTLALHYNAHVNLYSAPDETERAFQRRCRDAASQARDEEVAKVEAKYKTKLKQLEDRKRREELELEQDKAEHGARKQEELLSGAETLFGMLSGSRSSRRLSSASRKRRMTSQARADVKESEEVIQDLEKQIADVEKAKQQEIDELTEKWGTWIDDWQEEQVRPRRTDVQVTLFALAWFPHWEVKAGSQILSLPAFEVAPAQVP